MRNVIFLFAFFFPYLLLGQAKMPDREQLNRYISKSQKEWGVPGLSVAIVMNGEIVYSEGFGVLEAGKNEKPDGNTLYAIASNSKAFTSTMMAMLVQEKKLNWDDKVKKYLPWFELYDPWVSKEVTIRDLLCHRVGLGTFSGDIIWYKSNLSAEEIVRRVKFLPPAFGFRDGYGYSNLMYLAAGEVIRNVTGKSWSQNVQERILGPLKMNRTITSVSELKQKGNFATPHGLENDRNFPIEWVDWHEVAAMGGLISSVNDVAKWMIFNLNQGINGKDTLLTPMSVNTLTKLHNSQSSNHVKLNDFRTHFTGYGLGWGLSDFHGRMKVSHTGGYDGMLSAVTMIPDEKLGVVVLSNGLKSPMMAITNYILYACLGLPQKDWSAEMLKRTNEQDKADTRIADRIASHVTGTKPSLPEKSYAGAYYSDIYGKITVKNGTDGLTLQFEHSPDLAAKLEHWHYDVWKIVWEKPIAWLSFGTVKFNLDNNLKITGMDFDVPNNDIFFEELKPRRIAD